MAVTFVKRIKITITDSEIGNNNRKKLSETKPLDTALITIKTRVVENQTIRKGFNG